MNRKFKTIGAALLAAAMCTSLAGCGKSDPSVVTNPNSNPSTTSKSTATVSKPAPAQSAGTFEPEEMKIEITDEIKNAALNSGLVQFNNDIFQRGGYITVADFVEKLRGSYDFTYVYPQGSGAYDDCKDYLLQYGKDIFTKSVSIGYEWTSRSKSNYYLRLTPKKGGEDVRAYVVNATSPDEKITLDTAIVVEIASEYTPKWIPAGFNSADFKDEYEAENSKYTVKNVPEFIESSGIEKNSQFEWSSILVPSCSKENFNTYWKKGDGYGCYVLGETNLFGAKPIYYFSFIIDPNTDKVDYVNCTLEYFIKDET